MYSTLLEEKKTLESKTSDVQLSGEVRLTGYELTATKILDLITSTNLKPGDRLPTERALGESLGVSRTVVREAVKLLSATGVVRAQQGSGLYVSSEPHPLMRSTIDIAKSVDPKDTQSFFEFRSTIEQQTARLAAERITPRELRALQEQVELNCHSAKANQIETVFHESDTAIHIGIAEATRNPFLVAEVIKIHRLQYWITQIVTGGPPGSLLKAAEQHNVLVAAISKGQPDDAAHAMQVHIETVLESYQQEVRRRLRGDVMSATGRSDH